MTANTQTNPNAAPLDFLARAQQRKAENAANRNANGGQNGAGTGANDRPKAQIYLNFGVVVPTADDQGVVTETFIGLPYGLPLDTMSKLEIRGSNADWNDMAEAKNGLYDDLMSIANAMAPGSEQIIAVGDFAVQIRRVGEAARNQTNSLLGALRARLGTAG